MGLLRAFLTALISVTLVGSACGQKRLTDLPDNNELVIVFDHLGKPGAEKKYLIDLKDVPGSSPLPNAFSLIENKSYYVQNDAIYYGKPVYTFKIPVQTEEDFKKVRILRLFKNSLNSTGYEWRDCSILPQDWLNPPADVGPERKERMLKLLPDYEKKTISCMTDFNAENYFAAVFQLQESPVVSFSTLNLVLDKVVPSRNGSTTTYIVSIKNAGSKDIAEVNLRSDFDYDFSLTGIRPSQGKCQTAISRAAGDSDNCHLGALRAGAHATIEFTGESAGMQGQQQPRTPNLNWEIYGYIKERPNDPNWQVNRFSFNPLHK